ncbi:MAG: SpoIIE family protein phosphatase, partial [Chlamydiota bacterium]|nr:SpoIIE family protein phosphatase [Chlamydiota bacterium]
MAHLESESDNLNEKTRFLENQVQKLYGLIEASGAVISTLELEVVLDRVMEIAKKVIGAEASSLLLVNESSGNLAYTVALGEKGEDIKGKLELEKGKGIAGWVAQTGIPQLVTDVTKDSRFYGEVDKITGFKTRSIMCVPMKVHGKLIGVLEAINPVSSECFTPADLEILSAYAGLASIAIDNALMARQMIEKKAIEKELAIAREIQQKFLIHKFPECDTYKVYAKTQSSREIGGDFYDINWDDKGHIGVMIGDVCGRGIPAALYMIEVLSAWRTQQASQKTLCSCICKLNEDLIQKSTFGSFVTLLCSHLDTKTGSLRFINAGHVPLLIVNLEKKEARFVSDKN